MTNQIKQYIRGKGPRRMVILQDPETGLVKQDPITKLIENKIVRDKGPRKGVLIAQLVDGKVRIGWSYANRKAGDVFNEDIGVNIAIGRINNPSNPEKVKVPHEVLKALPDFIDRAHDYFKV